MSATDELSGFFERFGSAYRWFVITTTLMGTITVVLSSTIVNVALPDIMGAFGIGQDQAQWMSTGFLAAMTASMLVNAWLNDAIGIRATFVGSMALFAAASVLGGLAPNENVLTFARVAQGIAAAVDAFPRNAGRMLAIMHALDGAMATVAPIRRVRRWCGSVTSFE